jgi:hypothetical protein
MTKEEKQAQLNANYKRYLEERDRLAAEGKHIGTFSSWQFENRLVNVIIPMTREEHFGKS